MISLTISISLIFFLINSAFCSSSSYRSLFVPPLLLDSIAHKNALNLSGRCYDKLTQLVSLIDNGQLDSAIMFNSWGSFPPKRFASGETSDVGHYDQCFSVRDSQYCLVETRVPFPHKILQNPTTTSEPVRYANIQTGVCLPSVCDFQDVDKIGSLCEFSFFFFNYSNSVFISKNSHNNKVKSVADKCPLRGKTKEFVHRSNSNCD